MTERSLTKVVDRANRVWTIHVTTLDQNDEVVAQNYRKLTPEERIDLVGECILDMRKVQNKRGIPRFRRVYRVLER